MKRFAIVYLSTLVIPLLVGPVMTQGLAIDVIGNTAGHGLPDENPAFLAAQLAAFPGENGR
jgi:hypothetical protein